MSAYAAILVLRFPLSNDGELRIGGLNSYSGEFLVVLEGPTSRKYSRIRRTCESGVESFPLIRTQEMVGRAGRGERGKGATFKETEIVYSGLAMHSVFCKNTEIYKGRTLDLSLIMLFSH